MPFIVDTNGETMTLIWELVISKAQTLINKACMYDFSWDKHAKELDGKLICVNITQVDCTIFAKITDGQIILSSSSSETPDLSITGKPLTLMQLANSASPGSEAKIEGSAQLAQQIQKMMKSLDVDWEGFVALYTGDTIAHGLGKIKAQMEVLWTQSKENLTEDAAEYLLYELQAAAAHSDVSTFIDDVTKLRYSADRIEARINFLKDKVTDNVQ